jgi:hypothetical protein
MEKKQDFVKEKGPSGGEAGGLQTADWLAIVGVVRTFCW